METVRQDAWSEEDDLLLAETVLRHVREGSTQLQAFEEVGDKLDRTSAAVGFRWNAIVRKKYEQALKIAKRQRKEKKRMMAKSTKANQSNTYNEPTSQYETRFNDPIDFENYQPLSEPSAHQQPAQTNKKSVESSTAGANEQRTFKRTKPQVEMANEFTLDTVIDYLRSLKTQSNETNSLHLENDRLKNNYDQLLEQNKKLENQLNRLNDEYQNLKEDHQALLQIMDRARRMVLLQDDEDVQPSKFRMDKNGNLEKLAK